MSNAEGNLSFGAPPARFRTASQCQRVEPGKGTVACQDTNEMPQLRSA
jgi:hypothetical protein